MSLNAGISRFAAFVSAAALAFSLSGCMMHETAAATLVPQDGVALGGRLMGGQQPVSGATVYVVQTGTSGYGNSTLGANLATTSDANGSYSFPAGSYTCPSATTPILLEARGGNPGLAAGTNNAAIFMVAVAGLCGQLTPTTPIIINELTTVAAAYVLRPFMNGNNVGVPNSNAVGMVNAIATYNNLVNNSRGDTPGAAVPAGEAIPSLMIRSLANSLSACVNTTDGTSTACQNLFAYAQTATAGTTANVFVASAGIAAHPQTNAGLIYSLAPATPPFGPALITNPVDWAMNIVYTSGRLKSIHVALDVDAGGNVFVLTQGGSSGTVEELSNSGTLLRGDLLNNFIDGPTGLAINTLGQVAVTSATPGAASVLLMDGTGTLVSTYTDSNVLTAPSGVAFDAASNLVVTDSGANDILVLTTGTGGVAATLVRTVVDAGGPTNPALDGAGNLWLGKLGTNTVDRFAGGATGIKTSYTNSSVASNAYLSFDNAGNAITCGNGLYLFTFASSGYAATGLPTYESGAGGHKGMRVDGLGGAWCGLSYGSATYRLFHATSGFASSLYRSYNNAVPVISAGVAIDRSGNVWVASGVANTGLYEVVGAAAPVVTPVAGNLAANTFGSRP